MHGSVVCARLETGNAAIHGSRLNLGSSVPRTWRFESSHPHSFHQNTDLRELNRRLEDVAQFIAARDDAAVPQFISLTISMSPVVRE